MNDQAPVGNCVTGLEVWPMHEIRWPEGHFGPPTVDPSVLHHCRPGTGSATLACISGDSIARQQVCQVSVTSAFINIDQ